jgi:hypothetical protein
MGSERAAIEEEEKVLSPMQLNGPAPVQKAVPLIEEEEKVSSPIQLNSRAHVQKAVPLIQEEEKAAPQAPALDKSGLRPDVPSARFLAKTNGATPGRNWVEAGEILQGDANSARRRGEGRYGAAALHGIADLAVSAGSGEAGGAAAGAVKGVMKPLAAPAIVGKLAGDAVKYTVGGLVSAGGQAVQKIGDDKRDALDPLGRLEQQRLVDVANRHEHGIDMTSEEQGLTRREEVAARGVRMEQGDKAKKIWNGPKKRSWGRITQNAIAAPFRGIGKAVKSLVTSPAAGLKSTYNFFAKYGRKAVNGISNISWNRKRRANNALERLRERSEANGEDRYPAAPANALKADSPIKPSKLLNFRGADAAIRSHTRDVRKAQGFDNILGQKDYEKLSEGDRREYREKENVLLKTSPKYANAMVKAADDSETIRGIAQKFAGPDAQAQGDQQQAPANAPPGNAAAGADNDDFEMISDKDEPDLRNRELAKDSHPGMSIAAGIDKGVGLGEKLVETSKKLDMPVGLVTNFLGQQLPDMLEGQALEDYAPHAETAKAVGETFKSINENAGLYRAPLIGKGLHTGFDLYKTAKQSANRNKDANKTALNERRALEDTRGMSDKLGALLEAKKVAGASKESISRTIRLRFRNAIHQVTANRKLAKAQEMNGITPLNEYSKKESDFIRTGEYSKDEEVGAKGVGELGKELGKATVKTLKAMVGYTGANKADDTKEAERLYPPNRDAGDANDPVADPQLVNAGAHQNVIEDEEKRASGELSAGGDSQLGAAGVHQNVIKGEVNRAPGELDPKNRVSIDLSSLGHASGELNAVHHPDTNSFSQGQPSYPQQQRPSQVDFNMSDDDDINDDAVLADRHMDDDDFASEEVKDEPNELPPWITQIEESEGDEFHSRNRFSGGVEGKEPSANGKERVLAGHRGDITVDHQKVVPQYPNVGSDPEKPFGGNWKREDTGQVVQQAGIFGSNPDELYPNGEFHDEGKVEFQGGILAKEKIRAAPQAHKPAPAMDQAQRVIEEEEEKHASEELNTANRVRPDLSSQGTIHAPGESNAVHHSDTNSFSQGQPSYPQQQRPSQVDFNMSDDDDVNDNAVAAGGGGAKIDQPDDAGLDIDGDGRALGNGPMLNHLVDGQWQMMQEEEKGVAVEEEKGAGLDLPSARVHVPSDASDLPEWVTQFSGPGGELDFFDNEDEEFELGNDVIRNVDQYAPKMVEKSGRDETINRVLDGYRSNDKERNRVRKKFLKRERAREQDIDISSKRVLEGDAANRAQNRQGLQLPSEDAMANSGPMTIGGHEVVPEMTNKYHNPDRPQGGWWRSKATGQKLGYAGLAGAEPLVSPGGREVKPHGEFWQGNDVAAEKKREVRAKAKLDGIGSEALDEQLAEVSEQGRRQGYGGLAEKDIIQAPAVGWGNIGKKPGMFAGKKAKEEYKQKTKAIDPAIDDAWGKMKGEEMPSFMKGVPYAEKKWREKERDQRALEEQAELRKKWGMGGGVRLF